MRELAVWGYPRKLCGLQWDCFDMLMSAWIWDGEDERGRWTQSWGWALSWGQALGQRKAPQGFTHTLHVLLMSQGSDGEARTLYLRNKRGRWRIQRFLQLPRWVRS